MEQIRGCFRNGNKFSVITQPRIKYCAKCWYEPRSKECVDYTNEKKRLFFV